MHFTRLTLVVCLMALLVCTTTSVSASDADAQRVERNFVIAGTPGPTIPAISASDLRVTTGKLSVSFGWGSHDLEAITVVPPCSGPFPLAVVSHGNPRKGAKNFPRLRFLLPVAKDFARRGYTAVVFARRGFGKSTGSVDEGLSPHTTWSYAKAGRSAAEDYAAVIEAMAARLEIDGSKVIAAGVSGGGFAVTALASKPPAGLVGVVNFSGGRGSPKSYRNHNEEALVNAFAEFGTTARVPALWLYSMTDRFFWPEFVDRMVAAYAKGGAPVRLDRIGPLWFARDGHALVRLGGRELWRPRITAFLRAIGAPNWEADPGDAAVVILRPPERLHRRLHRGWVNYFGRADHKAFAVAEDGRGAWFMGSRDTPEAAKKDALRRCESKGDTCHIASVDGRMVP